MKKRLVSLIVAVAMMATMVAGCSVPGEDTSSSTSDTSTADESSDDASEEASDVYKSVTYSLTAEAPSVDPQLSNSVSSATINMHIGEGLTRNVEGDIPTILLPTKHSATVRMCLYVCFLD